MRYIYIKSIVLCIITHFINAREEALNTWSRAIAETFHTVNSKSYFPVTVEQAIVKALDAFVNQDEHSRFLGPKDYNELIKTTSGEFFGVGVIIAPKKEGDDFLLILDTMPGSPACKKGLQRSDKIIAINSVLVSTLSIEEAINKLKGDKRFSPVTLDIIRNNKELLSITLERDSITEEHIFCYYLPEQNIVYCALSLFTYKVAQQLETALRKALIKQPQGIILDLRDNNGGILQAAVDCAGLFLEKNSFVVCTKDRNQKIIERYFTKKRPLVQTKIPLFILVNNYTASAAEILAGALKIHAQEAHQYTSVSPYIFLVGTKTYGKGSVQEVIPMSNNCALKLTTCVYTLPDHTCLQHKGLIPDFIVEQKYVQPDETKLAHKLSCQESQKDWKSQRIESLKNDHQIQSAISLVLLLNTGLKLWGANITTWHQGYNWLKKNSGLPETLKFEELL